MRKACRPTPRLLKSETTIIERVEEEVMRQAEIERNTFETKIKLSLNLDAQEPVDIQTGVGFFDHMLTKSCTPKADEKRLVAVVGRM